MYGISWNSFNGLTNAECAVCHKTGTGLSQKGFGHFLKAHHGPKATHVRY